MKKIMSLMLVVGVLSFSAAAQSGVNRQSGGKQKKNQTQTSGETVTADQKEIHKNDSVGEAEPVTDDEILRVDTNLVTVPVSVSDRDGRFILNLKKEDFQIFENGKPQQVAYFAASEVPFTVALILDVSYSAHFKIDEIETAAYRFVMNLRPADKVMVISFDDEYHILSEPTNDRETLRRAINSAKIGQGTALYDTMSFAFERFAQIPGRKAIVLFTDGVDTTSRKSNDLRNLRQAQELDALVYTIHYDTYEDVQNASQMPPVMTPNPIPGSPVPFPQPNQRPTIPGTSIPLPLPQRRTTTTRDPNDPNYPPNYPGRRDPNDPNDPNNRPVILGGGTTPEEYRRGREYLEKLSANTGGRFYRADTYGNLGLAYDNIAEELRRQYSIGYYPENEGKAGEERRIKVKVNRDKAVVRAKDGYIVGNKKEAAKK
ncbi:MAG: VWA domain-containing protein [Acidobacteriota bacterium]|nr:VWA domain-containing protein [Acidobacteriota bacterium]